MPTYQVTISPKRGGVPVGGITGQVLTKIDNTDWNSSWQTPTGGAGGVTSVFTRTGAVVALSGDYSFSQIVGVSSGVLLGRGSAGVGAIEQITLGTNLSLSGTTLNASGGGGGGTWGSITGTLSAQTDLQTALNALVPQTTTVNGHALSGNVTVTSSDVGLGSVTNDAQTKAAIVPNTAPSAGQILVGNAGNTAYAKQTVSGSGATVTLSSAGLMTISAIANATLSNSSITIAGTSTALGGTITQDTITGLSSTGIIKRTAANTLAIATAGTDYLSGNQTITLSGVVTGSGTTAITTAFGSQTGTGSVAVVQNGPTIQDGSNATSVDCVNRQLIDSIGHPTVDWQNGGAGFANLRNGATVNAIPIVTTTQAQTLTNKTLVTPDITTGFTIGTTAGVGGQEVVSNGVDFALGNSTPDTMNDYGFISIPDTSNLLQPNRSTLSSTSRSTMAGTGRITIYDQLNNPPRKTTSSPGSFIIRDGEGILQYLRIIFQGIARATMTETARIVVTDLTPGCRLVLAGGPS